MTVLAGNDVWRMAAEMLAPAERLLPSEWAKRRRRFKQGHSSGVRWGDQFPWQRQIMDLHATEPHKRGWFEMKGAQLGGSDSVVSLIGSTVEQDPGPMLYLISTDELARRFGLHRFDYMIQTTPSLVERFLLGRKHNETILVKEFVGGLLVIAGSQSANKLMSDPFRYVFLDEVDRLPPEFKGVGTPLELAEARTFSFGRSLICGWSTPTVDHFGIAAYWDALSDQRRFMVECPHCGKLDWLKFSQVKWDEGAPETALYECEHCKKRMTDAQRAQAVKLTGRYVSTLPAPEAKRRRYAGFHISHLYNTLKPLSDAAAMWEECTSEGARQVFYNTVLGEPYTPSTRPLTMEMIDARALHEPEHGAPDDTMFVTMGVDVQHGEWFYVDISAWTTGRIKWLLAYPRLQGWDRLAGLLRTFRTQAGDRELGIRLACLDCGYDTSAVFTFCKEIGTNLAVPSVYATTPHGEFWKKRKIESARIMRYDMDRFYWMDRALARFAGDGVVLPSALSDEYRAHILANVQVATQGRFNEIKQVWVMPQGEHDDYLQAAVHAEFAAMMLGLDAMKQKAAEFQGRRKKAYDEAMGDPDRKPFIRDKWKQRRDRFVRRPGGKGLRGRPR